MITLKKLVGLNSALLFRAECQLVITFLGGILWYSLPGVGGKVNSGNGKVRK